MLKYLFILAIKNQRQAVEHPLTQCERETWTNCKQSKTSLLHFFPNVGLSSQGGGYYVLVHTEVNLPFHSTVDLFWILKDVTKSFVFIGSDPDIHLAKNSKPIELSSIHPR